MIDPYENSAWKGVGVANLQRAGVDFFELCETSSELKLPSLVQANAEPFDLVFLDGFHDFDHTMAILLFDSRAREVGVFTAPFDARQLAQSLRSVAPGLRAAA